MKLRPYQDEAASAFISALRLGCNPVVALPTGSGKSLVIAHLCNFIAQRGGRVTVLAHVQELLEQNHAEYVNYSGSTAAIYSAGLGLYSVAPVTFAGIQSVYRKPELFKDSDLVLIDEAHMVPPDGEGLMYKQFLAAIPNARRGGLTATPWRLDGGLIYGEGRYFDTLAYSKKPLELVNEGYLCPLSGVETRWQVNLDGVKKNAGEYSAGSVESRMLEGGWLVSAVEHSITQLRGRKHIVIFCPTVELSREVAKLYSARGVTCGYVDSGLKEDQRDQTLTMWKGGELRAVANVDILTTGFNFPALDCIINFRPTQSSALWVQMLGRGMRNAMGKADCLVLDYAGNLERLGGVGIFETWVKQKEDGKTEQRGEPKEKVKKVSPREAMKLALAAIDPMLESKAGLFVRVLHVNYAVTRSKQPGKSHLMVTYDCETEDGLSIPVTQFCCVEYTGGARFHAEQWFKRRGATAPRSAQMARVEAYSLRKPKHLTIRKNDGYINVEREHF